MSGLLLCYLAGPPGCGKSSAMAQLTSRCGRDRQPGPPAHEALQRAGQVVAAEVGVRRELFPGTDTLAMNIHPAACDWITTRPYPLILAEGARLATTGFLHAARGAGYQILLVHLTAPEDVLQARRQKRGTQQNPAWVRGATTRARRVAERMTLDADVHYLDTTGPPGGVATQIAALNPSLKVLTDA